MPKFDSRLLFFVLAVCVLGVIWSCSDGEDIVRPQSITAVWLTAERLPAPPTGMVYEIWVAKNPVTGNNIPAGELVSLGRFSYISNDTIVSYLEPDGTIRADSNEFVLDADMFSYANVFITVEDVSTQVGVDPGPIMLVETITGRSDLLRLNFPLDDALWDAIVRYNMEGVTDGNRFQNNGYGLWFSGYQYTRRRIDDVFGGNVTYEIDTIDAVIDTVIDIFSGDTTFDTVNLAELYALRPDTVWLKVDTFRVDFGPDTLTLDIDSFMSIVAPWRADSVVDSTPPFTSKKFDIDREGFVNFRTVGLDIFVQDDYRLPDYSDWGWKYKGWIVSDSIPANAIGNFTPPAWRFLGANRNDIPGYQGGLLTTGTFSKIDEPDDGDPFTLKIMDRILTDSNGVVDTTYKRPGFPGEDFLDGAALSAATNGVISAPFNLLPAAGGNTYGSVFISLEPANRLTDSTNFPLIAFLATLPSSWSADATSNTWSAVTLVGKFGSVPNDDSEGFPEIVMRIKRM